MYRIGIDARMYRPGATGIGRYIDELVKNLINIDQDNEYVLFLNEDAYHSYTCPNQRISKRHTKADYYSIGEQTLFLQDLLKEDLDLVHFTHFNAPVLYTRPFVVTIHDLTLSKFPGQKMNTVFHRLGYNIAIKSVISNAKKIISVSKHTASDVEKILKCKKEKIEVIYEGISDKFKPMTDKKKIAEIKKRYELDRPFFLYVGVWRNHKNLVNLIEAFNLFRNKYDLDYKLLLTGKEDNIHYPEVRNKIEELHISKFVITPGFVEEEDLVGLYSSAQALVNPSYYEGFGFPPLEAMACGNIAVVSDASCHKEIYKDAAIYFNPDNIEDIADKLNLAVSDKKEISKVQINSKKIMKDYTWIDCATKTHNLYLNVLKNLKFITKNSVELLNKKKKESTFKEEIISNFKDVQTTLNVFTKPNKGDKKSSESKKSKHLAVIDNGEKKELKIKDKMSNIDKKQTKNDNLVAKIQETSEHIVKTSGKIITENGINQKILDDAAKKLKEASKILSETALLLNSEAALENRKESFLTKLTGTITDIKGGVDKLLDDGVTLPDNVNSILEKVANLSIEIKGNRSDKK